jgi:hypothetical protein
VPVALPAFVKPPDVGFPVLPQGIHDADLPTVESRLVDDFAPNEAQRRQIYDGWMAYRGFMYGLLPVTAEYIDGSFVTEKPNPKDVDVSFWVDADAIRALDATGLANVNWLLANAGLFFVDAYVVPECDPGHPDRQLFDQMLWTEHYWTRCRDVNNVLLPAHGARKGYLRIVP